MKHITVNHTTGTVKEEKTDLQKHIFLLWNCQFIIKLIVKNNEMAQIINCSWICCNHTPHLRKFGPILCKYTVYLGHLHIAYAET